MIALAIILGILILILLIPVGVYAKYDGEATVKAVAGPLKIQILPAKPKTRKQLEKEEKKKAANAVKKAEQKQKAEAAKLIHKDPPPPKPDEPLMDKVRGLLPFARLAVDALGSVFRRLTIKKLIVHVRFGGSDPSKLAENYGKIMAIIGGMGPILNRKFKVKHGDVSVVPDFSSSKTEVEAELYMRYLIFDLLGIAFKYGFRGIKLLIARKKHEKQLLAQQQKEKENAEQQPGENNVEKAVS